MTSLTPPVQRRHPTYLQQFKNSKYIEDMGETALYVITGIAILSTILVEIWNTVMLHKELKNNNATQQK